jgi:hypothetical protein
MDSITGWAGDMRSEPMAQALLEIFCSSEPFPPIIPAYGRAPIQEYRGDRQHFLVLQRKNDLQYRLSGYLLRLMRVVWKRICSTIWLVRAFSANQPTVWPCIFVERA